MENSSPRYVIVTAGGSGTRMGSVIPKQMLEIEGKPILRYTIEKFLSLPFDVKIILVMNKDAKESWKDYCRESGFRFNHILVEGGITRFHSVKNGLKYVPKGAVVAVHDGVRPFISKDKLIEIYNMAEEKGVAIPCMKSVESMRMADDDGKYVYVDRERYYSVQTPQVFKSDILLESYEAPFSPEFTDDASVVEKAGYPLVFCEGTRYNIKITTPEDMGLARAIISLGLDNL
jgi:2-C-methyl-D-erythritol 4-phosphate cytidylyltransferase